MMYSGCNISIHIEIKSLMTYAVEVKAISCISNMLGFPDMLSSILLVHYLYIPRAPANTDIILVSRDATFY